MTNVTTGTATAAKERTVQSPQASTAHAAARQAPAPAAMPALATLEAVRERITYANEDKGDTVARVATRGDEADLLFVGDVEQLPHGHGMVDVGPVAMLDDPTFEAVLSTLRLYRGEDA